MALDSGLLYGCLTPHAPVLVPEVGGPRVEQVCRTREAMQQVANDVRALSPDAVVLVSPHAPILPHSMTVFFSESYLGGFGAFGAPSVKLSAQGDPDLASAIEAEAVSMGVPTVRGGRPGVAHALDHGAAVPLTFLQGVGVQCRLVLMGFSDLGIESHRRFGRAIAAAARASGKRVVMVASGDMSHRLIPGAPAGFSPQGRRFDEAMASALRCRDYRAILEVDQALLYEAGECGYRSLVIALGALAEAESEVLSYEGPFGVGYLVARFRTPGLPPALPPPDETERREEPAAEELEVLRLARLAVESHIRGGKMASLFVAPVGLLARKAGVFVSLKIDGRLRGCIGTFRPTEPNVATEILRNAVAAASRDPRFSPVTRGELPRLQYSVDVLSNPEPVEDEGQLDPKHYGVMVQAGARRGLLLPDLEGVTSVAAQVEIARQKAGIAPGAGIQLYRFTVRRIGEGGRGDAGTGGRGTDSSKGHGELV